jgi:uncharacterized protein
MRRALLVIGKAPIAGRTKTRLVPPLTADEAAALYRGFLLDTLDLAMQLHWERTALVHPRGHTAMLREVVPAGINLIEQPHEGLADALAYAFDRHFTEGFDRVVLIGSDNPTLNAAPLRDAEAALDGADLAIGRTLDGGYYLIGMRQPRLGVFEGIDWSTPRVYAQTLARATHLHLRVHEVAQWYDVDEPADLERLQSDLATSPRTVARHTRVALRAMQVAPVP